MPSHVRIGSQETVIVRCTGKVLTLLGV